MALLLLLTNEWVVVHAYEVGSLIIAAAAPFLPLFVVGGRLLPGPLAPSSAGPVPLAAGLLLAVDYLGAGGKLLGTLLQQLVLVLLFELHLILVLFLFLILLLILLFLPDLDVFIPIILFIFLLIFLFYVLGSWVVVAAVGRWWSPRSPSVASRVFVFFVLLVVAIVTFLILVIV
jgi:hypothetical protein